jgi:RNase adaptor protein for sRNA GlmZ degradation
MPSVRILVVTGASGTGKTTLVHEVEARGIAGASFHYFDSIGVPSAEQMVREFGSAASWQIAMTNRWLERLARCESRLCVLEGQVRPTTVLDAFARYQIEGRILLLDCTHVVREARLRDQRRQPELNTRDMACWASYLRGQADALGLPVLDTSAMTAEDAGDALFAHVSALASI